MAKTEQQPTARPRLFWVMCGVCAVLAISSLLCLVVFYSGGDSEKLRSVAAAQQLRINLKTGEIEGNIRQPEQTVNEAEPEPAPDAPEPVPTAAFDVGEEPATTAPEPVENQPETTVDDFIATDDEVADAIPAYPRTNASLNPAPNPELNEDGLPKAGAAGTPMRHYARPFTPRINTPVIAIIVTNMGASKTATETALRLPLDVSLAFNPYAEYTPLWFEGARNLGHESWLMLPAQPEDFPASDPGPLALLRDVPASQNLARLHEVMRTLSGYVGFVLPPHQIATDAQPTRDMLLAEAKLRGLSLMLSTRPESPVARTDFDRASDQSLQAHILLDADPHPDAIAKQLAALQQTAKDKGFALGVSHGYPVTLTALDGWLKTLDQTQFQLAPATALMGRK